MQWFLLKKITENPNHNLYIIIICNRFFLVFDQSPTDYFLPTLCLCIEYNHWHTANVSCRCMCINCRSQKSSVPIYTLQVKGNEQQTRSRHWFFTFFIALNRHFSILHHHSKLESAIQLAEKALLAPTILLSFSISIRFLQEIL